MASSRLIGLMQAWAIALVALTGIAAHAHQAPNSEAYVDFHERHVTLDIVIPAAEYAYASGNLPAGNDAARTRARRYLLESISAQSGGAGGWKTRVERLDFVEGQGGRDLVATLSLSPIGQSVPRRFTLVWGAIIGEVPDHFVLVMLRRDPAAKLGDEPIVIGTLRGDRTTLAIDRGAARSWLPFANAVRLGAAHILGGIDHLAFLLALLLPLPLIARSGRWQEARGIRPAVRSVAILISGFTIGHSATLIAASLGGLSLPPAIVETLIALSVLIAAIHAIRPLFPRREALFATVFGLVHGLGFAGFLSATDLSMARNTITLLGFNIGIELVQLTVALAIVPALLVLARTAGYRWLRMGLSLFSGTVASIWVWDRYFGLDQGFIGAFERSVELVLAAAFVGVLAVAALVLFRRAVLSGTRLA